MLLLTSLSSRRSARASTSLSVNFGPAASAASRAGEHVSKQRTTATEREGLGFSDKSLDRYDEKRPVEPGSFVHRRLKELRAKKRLRNMRNQRVIMGKKYVPGQHLPNRRLGWKLEEPFHAHGQVGRRQGILRQALKKGGSLAVVS